jgi:hypothetical protein
MNTRHEMVDLLQIQAQSFGFGDVRSVISCDLERQGKVELIMTTAEKDSSRKCCLPTRH